MFLHTEDKLLQHEEQLPAHFPTVNWPIWGMVRGSQAHIVKTQQLHRKSLVSIQGNEVSNPPLMHRPLIHAAIHKLKILGNIRPKRRGKLFKVVVDQILEETGASAAQCVCIDGIRQQLPTDGHMHNKIGLVRRAKPNYEPILDGRVILEALEQFPGRACAYCSQSVCLNVKKRRLRFSVD